MDVLEKQTEAPERRGGFQPGKSGNEAGRPRGGTSGELLLAAMRTVVARAEKYDTTQAQKECRKWLREDRKGFMAKLADMEKAVLISKAQKKQEEKPEEKTVATPSEEDAGATRVGELIERLLEEFK